MDNVGDPWHEEMSIRIQHTKANSKESRLMAMLSSPNINSFKLVLICFRPLKSSMPGVKNNGYYSTTFALLCQGGTSES